MLTYMNFVFKLDNAFFTLYYINMEVTVFNKELHNRIAEMLIAGERQYKIAQELSCTTNMVYDVLRNPKFSRLMYEHSMAKLTAEGVPAAVQALIEIVMNKKNSASSRVSAADKIFQYTGCLVNEQGKLEKAPSQMTQAELQQRLQALQAEAGNRAQPAQTVDISPVDVTELF